MSARLQYESITGHSEGGRKKHVCINKGLRVIAGGSRIHLNTELHPPNKQILCHAAVITTPEARLLIFTPLHIYRQGDIEKQWASFQSSGNVEFKCFQYKHRAAGSTPLLTGLTLPGEDTHTILWDNPNWYGSGAFISLDQIIFHTSLQWNIICLCPCVPP